MKETKDYRDETVEETITNGWVNNEGSASNPGAINKVTYINPKTRKPANSKLF